LLILAAGSGRCQEAPARPSFIVILTDDQRWDALGHAGHPVLQTPTMDRLAREGVRFRSAFVTTSICAASRASILSSRFEGEHGFSFRTPPLAQRFADESYPRLLRRAGYRTALIGKCGVKFEKGASGELFDHFRPLSPPYVSKSGKGVRAHLSDRTGEAAVSFLRTVGEQPFCLSLWFNAPHAEDSNPRQYVWPPALADLYGDCEIPEPPKAEPAFFLRQPAFLRDSLNRVRWFWRFDTARKRVEMTRGYYRMIHGVDRVIDRVLEELELLGRTRDTVVVLTSDNGYFLGERGFAGKWLPYEESIRVPLIVFDPRSPDALRGSVRDEMVLNVDIAPTLLELAGVDKPVGYQGRSLQPLLSGEDSPWRDDFFYEHRTDIARIPKCEAVRGKRWKYIRYYEQKPLVEELYDLRVDPQERANRALDPSHAETLQRMRERCDELSARYATAPSIPSSLRVRELRCEYRRDPLGIDVLQPRLTWTLAGEERAQAMSAYRILVSSSMEELKRGAADLWDSGKVPAATREPIPYGGLPLGSRRRCFWRVRAWDRHGRATPWSAPASWEMGLLVKGDWKARWIEDGRPIPKRAEDFYADDPAPVFRSAFVLPAAVQRARLHISGLGCYEARINGKQVGERVLDPAWTNYAKRVLYSSYDVTALVRKGDNEIRVELGKGWFDPLPLKMWGRLNLREHLCVGRPRFIAQLEIALEDGRRKIVASDRSWSWAPGPLLRNNLFLGEIHDARREPGDWQPAVLAPDDLGELRAQALPPVMAGKRLRARALSQPEPGIHVFDFGENLAGVAELLVRGPRGTRVEMRFGELLNEDGSLNTLTSACGQIKRAGVGGPGAPPLAYQSDTYVLAGSGLERYRPRFTFHGFRYVELHGFPGKPSLDSVVAIKLHSELEPALSFSCSNESVNRIQAMVRRTFLSNALGVQSDCPHRERFGYGGDIVPTAEAFMLQFNMAGFYAKTVRDFQDAARSDGALTMTAPFVGIAYAGFGGESGPIGWGHAHPLMLRLQYRYYGDRRLVAEQYETVQSWVEFMAARLEDGKLDAGLSDHESLEEKPVAVTSTAFFHEACMLLHAFAEILDRPADQRRAAELAARTREAFQRHFVDLGSGRIGNDTQCALATALYHELLPETHRALALARLEAALAARDGHLATGIFGTHYLLESLSRAGRSDLAYAVVTRPGFPGWVHMLDSGATTLWETWRRSNDTFSHNHPMFGSVAAWTVRWLAGLAPSPDAVGFDRVLLRPQPVGDLRWARAEYRSLRGLVRSAWRREEGGLQMEFTLPVGVTAELELPRICDPSTLRESGRGIAEVPGVERLGAHRYRLGSGRYRFEATLR